MEQSKISSYAKILEIRLKAYRRNLILAGAVFLIPLLAFFVFGMFELLNNQRELLLSGLLLVLFGMVFISAFVRYDIVKNTLDITQAISGDD